MKHDPDFMRKIDLDLAARRAARKILAVDEGADLESIKQAYRKAAVRHHPDHNGNTTEATRKFALIKCAYELLAFDAPCEALLAEINSWQDPDVPEDSDFKLDNSWGHFCWWKEKFFE
jgi:preprotein translocase subunit Sec63